MTNLVSTRRWAGDSGGMEPQPRARTCNGGAAVTFTSDGSRIGNLLLEVFRDQVNIRGGNVQFAVTGKAA